MHLLCSNKDGGYSSCNDTIVAVGEVVIMMTMLVLVSVVVLLVVLLVIHIYNYHDKIHSHIVAHFTYTFINLINSSRTKHVTTKWINVFAAKLITRSPAVAEGPRERAAS